MNGHGKSDRPVVPANPPNKAVPDKAVVAEVGEERGRTEGNTAGKPRPGRSAGWGVSQALDRVRQVAATDKEARFTALLHHVSIGRLHAAYWAINPKAAPGVDRVTWDAYGQALGDNLRDLHERVQAGRYRALPSRRAYIPKADGRSRPLGIATLEDKIVQRAVVEVLNAVYEVGFRGFSYGFRPGRGPHRALDALAVGITGRRVNWVLDADIRDFFGQLDRAWLRRFLEHRIADRRVLRLIDRWLAAGVVEDGEWTQSEVGSPQGASVSPLLANVYLHYVLDLWADWWRHRHAHGDVIIVRFADDFIVGFEHRDDTERFLAELRERLVEVERLLRSHRWPLQSTLLCWKAGLTYTDTRGIGLGLATRVLLLPRRFDLFGGHPGDDLVVEPGDDGDRLVGQWSQLSGVTSRTRR